MGDGAVDARQCLVEAAQLLERPAEQVVGGRVFRRNLDGLTKELDGFRGTLELYVGDAEKTKRVDVLRLEFQNLGVPRRGVGDGAAPVHVQPVLQQTGRQRAGHPAPRPINMRHRGSASKALTPAAFNAPLPPKPRDAGRLRPSTSSRRRTG